MLQTREPVNIPAAANEPKFLPQGLDLELEMLILSHKSLACLRAVGHTSDDRDETMPAERDGLQNRRLDALVPVA